MSPPFLSVAWMSGANVAYYQSWKGRFVTAWRILRHGHYPDDMTFDTRDQVQEFTKHLNILADQVFAEHGEKELV